jgi:hypothetical protein
MDVQFLKTKSRKKKLGGSSNQDHAASMTNG